MKTVKDLQKQPAVNKLKELAEEARLCMFNTRLCGAPFNTRPMVTQSVDDNGAIWFFSAADSSLNLDIARDNRAQLIYSNRSALEFLSIYGTVEILVDEKKAKKLWNVYLTAWFPDGPDDPNLTLLKFTPLEGYYWDTRYNKMIESMKVVAGAIKGRMANDALEGKLSVN